MILCGTLGVKFKKDVQKSILILINEWQLYRLQGNGTFAAGTNLTKTHRVMTNFHTDFQLLPYGEKVRFTNYLKP
jgi:hypothetical protein